MTAEYRVQQREGSEWRQIDDAPSLLLATAAMETHDRLRPGVARRVVAPDGRAVCFNLWHSTQPQPVSETSPFWIVMSLDKPGPCERDGQPYHRHSTEAEAKAEARRLSASCRGGRFAVMEAVWVTGWVEEDLRLEIPF